MVWSDLTDRCRTLKAISGLYGWMGWDGYTTTALTPRASLQSDSNKTEISRKNLLLKMGAQNLNKDFTNTRRGGHHFVKVFS